MLKPRKLRRAARSVGKAIEEGLERVGTATTRGATRQKGRRRNVVTKNDPKTGKLINITRGQRVRRGAGVTAAGTGATGAAATAASAADKPKKTGTVKRRGGGARAAASKSTARKPMSQADRKAARTGARKVRAADQATKDAKIKANTARFQKDIDDLAKANIRMNKAEKAKKAATVTKPKPAAPKPAATAVKPEKKKVKRVGSARKMSKRKFAGGGMASKMSAKGGARGGKRMPGGMKNGGMAKKGYALGGPATKNKKKSSFPDLTGDGRVTQADILKGRGVIKKKNGGMMKSKGMAKGGAMTKKGMAKGGAAMKKKGYAKGGMAKKGYSKGGAVRRGKPRGVGVALRGYGKALK